VAFFTTLPWEELMARLSVGRSGWRAPAVVWLVGSVVSAAAAALLLTGARAAAQAPDAEAHAPDAEDVAEGMRLYRTKGDCQSCHGWAADGRKMDTQMPDGANLRTTRLGREALLTAMKCGRPGRGMPAFDRLAYSDGRCYDMKLADLQRKGLDLPDPPATLQVREMERILDFLQAKVIGKGPMDRARCIEYWGSEVDVCKEFPN
jgi:mono/diheme cytochrome c family protein